MKQAHPGRLASSAALIVLLLASILQTASAATGYVSTTGNDTSGTGASNTPWASVTNAVAHATSGDTILVGAGVYTQSVTFAALNNLTIRGGYNSTTWAWDPANQPATIFGNGTSPIVMR